MTRTLGFLLFSSLLFAPFALAEANQIRCTGVIDSAVPLELFINADDTGLLRARLKRGDTASVSERLTASVTYQVNGPSTIHWNSPLQKDVITVTHVGADDYKITYQVPETPVGSMKTRLVKGESKSARCKTNGKWATQIEESAPESLSRFIDSRTEIPPDRLITLLRDTNYSQPEKEILAAILDFPLTAHDRQLAIQAIFSSNLSPTVQKRILDKIKPDDASFAATAIQALATCADCEVHTDIYKKFGALVQTQMIAQSPEAFETWKAFAHLTFRKKSEASSYRKEALELIFSRAALDLASTDQQLGTLAQLLTIEIPTQDLSSDHAKLLYRIVDEPGFGTQASIHLVGGLVTNHSNQMIGQKALDPRLHMNILKKMEAKGIQLGDLGTQHLRWVTAEALVFSTPTARMVELATRSSDEILLENILEWACEQTEPVPHLQLMLSRIMLKVDEPRIQKALSTFAFSSQAKNNRAGYIVLQILLNKQILSNRLLTYVGLSLNKSENFSPEESGTLLSLVIANQDYTETAGEVPDGMISTFLEQALERERTFKPTDPPPKFSVPLLYTLLKSVVDTNRIDRSLESGANQLLRRSAPL